MKNIVWVRPDGGVSVTRFAPEAEEKMTWAAENAGLLARKDALQADLVNLDVQIVFAQQDAEFGAERDISSLVALRSAVKSDLLTIAKVEEIRDTIGLDEHGHELILLARAQEAYDADRAAGGTKSFSYIGYVCKGHNLPIPADRTFRNAWKCDGQEVTHDIAKCQELTKERLRKEREPLFALLDVMIRDAQIEKDHATLEVALAERDRLRDVTKLADGVTDLEALKAIRP